MSVFASIEDELAALSLSSSEDDLPSWEVLPKKSKAKFKPKSPAPSAPAPAPPTEPVASFVYPPTQPTRTQKVPTEG